MSHGRATQVGAYAFAVLFAGVALGLQLVLHRIVGYTMPFLLCTLGVVCAGCYGGAGPGLLTTALCAIGVPVLHLGVQPEFTAATATAELIFLAVGLITSLLNGRLHVAQRRLEQRVSAEQAARTGAEAQAAERSRSLEDLRNFQEHLLRAKDEAETGSRTKDAFMATLSHELRTPLTPMRINVDVLRTDRRLPPDVREMLDSVHRNLTLEVRLVDDLLDVTRICHGKLTMRLDTVDFRQVLNRTVEIVMPDVQSKRILLDASCNAEHRCVRGDPDRLQQILWNLIKNAIKFTPDGGRIIVRTWNDPPGLPPGERPSVLLTGQQCNGQARLLGAESSEPRLIVEVADNGVGIDPSLLPRLFRPFEQGDGDMTRRFGGLGLGLAISRGLVEKHGGTICAYSPGPGRGATFRIVLPTVPSPRPAAPPPPPEPPRISPQREARILMVDDHPDTAHAVAALLESFGYAVLTAHDMATAIRIAEEQDFDLIISDLGLPDGNGLDLLRMLRDRRPTLNGIALSGYGTEDDIRKSVEAGFLEHLTKPIDIDRLELAVQRAVGQPQQPSN